MLDILTIKTFLGIYHLQKTMYEFRSLLGPVQFFPETKTDFQPKDLQAQ